jgi:hypothetical protein
MGLRVSVAVMCAAQATHQVASENRSIQGLRCWGSPKGRKGPNGPKRYKGPKGPQGRKGRQGRKGPKGIKGIKDGGEVYMERVAILYAARSTHEVHERDDSI